MIRFIGSYRLLESDSSTNGGCSGIGRLLDGQPRARHYLRHTSKLKPRAKVALVPLLVAAVL